MVGGLERNLKICFGDRVTVPTLFKVKDDAVSVEPVEGGYLVDRLGTLAPDRRAVIP